MKRRMWLTGALLLFLWATPAAAKNRFIVRSTLGSQGLSQFCLLQNCTVVGGLDGNLNQLFLLTIPDTISPQTFLTLLQNTPGIVNAEFDQLLSLVGGLNKVTTPPSGLSDTSPFSYYGSTVWNGYANQPAAVKVGVQQAQTQFNVAGTGIVADIDTGVDPSHPALQPVLLQGYDFTRNQAGASELNDLSPADFPALPPPSCTSTNCPSPTKVNQSTAAVLDQSTAAVLDQNVKYAAFGHGTMVMGVIHLVAPQAHLLPLKAFQSDGTAFLSDILRAIYYAVQNNANVINMSLDTKTNSQELQFALDYASQLNVISAASAGNDGQNGNLAPVYPAAYQNDVMGVASTDDLDQRSSFSNFGNAIVWVAAPGEAIVTTYPYSTYAAGWGTSFSAPFVSGTSGLLLNKKGDINQSQAAAAVAHAVPIGPDMGHGRLDIVQALGALQTLPPPPPPGTQDFAVSASPSSETVKAGQPAEFKVSAKPSGGFNQTVTWSCSGLPAAATCTVSPSSVTLDGTNSANVTITVTTTARSFLPPWTHLRFAPRIRTWGLVAICFAWVLLFAQWTISRNLSAGSRMRPGICAAAVLLVAAVCASCGGGASYNPPPPPQGTPQGTYPVTVTGNSGNVSHTTTFKLTVN